MKLKRIFAGVVAASVASTLAIGAFAETKTIKPNDPGELFYGGLDIYFGEIGSSILDDVTVLNGALSVTINFEVSDFEEYGEEFAVYVYYYQIDWDNVDWDAEDLEFDEGFGDDVVISEDGVYSATLEFNAPLEVDEEFLYLGLWSDDNDGSTPVIEVIDLEVAYEDEPETDAPETDAPETDAPETEAPETEAPETEAPETEAPETEAPETEAPAPGVSGDVEPDGSDNPETGVALAVAPVALAAAALAAAGVATKKRK